MSELFSPEWMARYQEQWNTEPELANALENINFNSVIGYGFKGDKHPIGFLEVKNGHALSAGAYSDQSLNWDLRADPDDWQKWLQQGLNMMSLGMAYMGGKLKFEVGDYYAIVKDPRMVGPFIKSFTVMGRV